MRIPGSSRQRGPLSGSSWFSTSMAYYGLAMDLQKFGLSVYLVQVLFGVIDIPAMLVATTTMIYVGRRATVASFLILAGLMVIANMFVPEDMQTLRTAQAALGKGCLASSFICVYLFTGELYPTEIRAKEGVGRKETEEKSEEISLQQLGASALKETI